MEVETIKRPLWTTATSITRRSYLLNRQTNPAHQLVPDAVLAVLDVAREAMLEMRVVGDTTVTSYQPDVFFCDQRVASTLPS
jgi:hypothetical protein